MANQELVSYIRKALSEGNGKEEIKDGLLKRGWPLSEVEAAFFEIQIPQQAPQESVQKIDTVAYMDPTQPMNLATPNEDVPLTQLPGFTTLFSETFRIFFAQWRTYLAIMLLPLALSFSMGVLWAIIFAQAGRMSLIMQVSAIAAAVIMSVLAFFTFIWAQPAFIIAVKEREKRIGFKEAFNLAKPQIFSYAWIGFLFFFTVLGGLILGIIPGIIFGIWFSFAFYVLIYDNIKGKDALFKSRELIRGYWMPVFLKSLAFNLIIGIALTMVFGVIFLILSRFTDLFKGDNFSDISVNGSFSFLSTIFSALIFENLKRIKSGKELPASSSRIKNTMRIFSVIGVLVASLLIIGALVAAFVSKDFKRLMQDDNVQQEVQAGLETFYLYNGVYPNTLDELVQGGFIESIPSALSKKDSYTYESIDNGKDYNFCVNSEKGERNCVKGKVNELVPALDTWSGGIYESERLAFQLLVPAGWLVDDSEQYSTDAVFFFSPEMETINDHPLNANVVVASGDDNQLDLEAYIAETKESMKSSFPDYTVLSEKKGDSSYPLYILETSFSDANGTKMKNMHLMAIKLGRTYELVATAPEESWDKYKTTFNDMIGGFVITYEI